MWTHGGLAHTYVAQSQIRLMDIHTRRDTRKPDARTHVVFALVEDVPQELLHVVFPKGVLQVLGARQHALFLIDDLCSMVCRLVGLCIEMQWQPTRALTYLGDVEEDGVRLQHLVDVRLRLWGWVWWWSR